MTINYNQPLTYVEIDFKCLKLKDGEQTCTEANDYRCFAPWTAANTISSDHEIVNHTYIFHQDSPYTLTDVDSFPVLDKISLQASTLSYGLSLGTRLRGNITFHNFLHNMSEIDAHAHDRNIGDGYKDGSFWGKLTAIQPFCQGFPIRIKRGFAGMDYADFETQHLFVDSVNGDPNGDSFSIAVYDIFMFLDDEKAVCPRPTQGRLLNSITSTATAASLTPSGIGNAEYPASGHLCIGGKEICAFTRSGDSLTLDRAEYNTAGIAHDEDESVQLCVVYDDEQASYILNDLLIEYTDVDDDWITYSEWQDEDDTYLDRLYGACISEPTPVKKLVNELLLQTGSSLVMDEIEQEIKFTTVKEVSAGSREINDDDILEFSQSLQDSKLITGVLTYYNRQDPTRKLDEKNNYKNSLYNNGSITAAPVSAIKEIQSRWIGENGYDTAIRTNEILLNRFQIPPKIFGVELYDNGQESFKLAQGLYINSKFLYDGYGQQLDPVPCRVIRKSRDAGKHSLLLEELNLQEQSISGSSPGVRTFTIVSDITTGLNLRELHDSQKASDPESGDEYTFIVENSVKVGGFSQGIETGSWPSGVSLTLQINTGAYVVGRGGVPGYMTDPAHDNQNGGDGLKATYALTVKNYGTIAGAGGSGATARLTISPYTITTGGAGAGWPFSSGGSLTLGQDVESPAGDGGNLGDDGVKPGSVSFYEIFEAGVAGNAVVGDSNITWSTTGTRIGDIT